MKTTLVAVFVAAVTLLSGCIVVPAGPGYYGHYYGHHDRYYR